MTQAEIVNRAMALMGEGGMEESDSLRIGIRAGRMGTWAELRRWLSSGTIMFPHETISGSRCEQEFIVHTPWIVMVHEEPLADNRELRFGVLRAEGKKLGEINAILEAEGFSEVFGEDVMPCPTKSHEIVRANQGAKQMIKRLEGNHEQIHSDSDRAGVTASASCRDVLFRY